MIKPTPEAYVAIKDQLGSVLHGGCIYVKDRRKLKYKANLRQRKETRDIHIQVQKFFSLVQCATSCLSDNLSWPDLQSWLKLLGTPRMISRTSRYVVLLTQVPKFFVPLPPEQC